MGVCSALFELGGMCIMHDASGCNSTYNTHDEPRWYDFDSMVYISGLSEMEAIMGDDEKLIGDITDAARELSPRFIAVAGTPIPMMTGTDFDAIAAAIEERTGIPSFGFSTNSMHSYINGVSAAFDALARRMVKDGTKQLDTANIIGLTPLDFSVNGYAESVKKAVSDGGFRLVSSWAMGDSLNNIELAAQASVNLVVSYDGMAAARTLKERFGTPFVAGVPVGAEFTDKLIGDMKYAASSGDDIVSFGSFAGGGDIAIIGESIMSCSLAAALMLEHGAKARVICPLETEPAFLMRNSSAAEDEDDIVPLLNGAATVIADPLYKPICGGRRFVSLPSEAFSGRIYRKDIPDLLRDFNSFRKEV